MSTPRLLPGPSNSSAEQFPGELDKLRRENQNLQRQVGELDDEVRERDKQIAQLERSLEPIRRQLLPWHQAICALFGEFDKAFPGGADTPATTASQPQSTSFWETQKRRFPGKQADIIDLLLERPMTVMQIVTAGRMDRKTIYNHIGKLTKAGLVTNSGGVFSLTRQ